MALPPGFWSNRAESTTPSSSSEAVIERLALDDGEDVILPHQENLLVAVELEFVTRVAGENHRVANLDGQRLLGAVLGGRAVTNGDDLALLRLILGGIREHDASGGRLLGFLPLDHHSIAQRLDVHRDLLSSLGDSPELQSIVFEIMNPTGSVANSSPLDVATPIVNEAD